MKTGYSFGSLVSFVEALDAAAVKITGDQTIAGLKTFSSNPVTSAAQGDGGGYLTRKDYVDGALALKAPLASPALTGVPTAPTAAQFDNDTSLATTAFVQRALGNMRASFGITGATTLTKDDVGKFVNVVGTGYTITLPPVTGVADGTSIFFRHLADIVGSVTIDADGAEIIRFNNVTVPNIALLSGESLQLTTRNNEWRVADGSLALTSGASSIFAKSFAPAGYQKLPSGLIVQWAFIGLAPYTSSLLNFPIAFPTAGLAIVGSRRSDGSNTSYNFSIDSATQLRAQNTAGGTETAHYIAIGY